MAIDKLIPQYLNKDDDERLVKAFEMTDALNVRVSQEENGNQGIVKNVPGTEAIGPKTIFDTVPFFGENRVIGATPVEAGKCFYFFLYNSTGLHGIYRYDSVTDKYQKLYQDEALNFAYDSFVSASVVVNQFEEHLLYFTDNRNEPRKINATKALVGGYPDIFDSGTDEQKEKFLTVCKQPPQEVITFQFQNNENYKFNNLKENCFQFAYQYVYDDGEVSALSAYSSLSVSVTNLAYNAAAIRHLSELNNELAITVTNSDGPVEKIRVFARKNNETTFFKIEELDNDPAVDTQTFTFRNDRAYTVLSPDESNKTHDAVPKAAAAQTFSNNRLFYGDYLEGFDNIETNVYDYPVYHKRDDEETDTLFNAEQGLVESETFNINELDYDTYLPTGAFDLEVDSINTTQDSYFRAYQGGSSIDESPYVNSLNDICRFGDSTTNGINFEIDLSEFPQSGINSGDGQVSFNVSLNVNQIGFAPDFRDHSVSDALCFPVKCSTYVDGDDTPIHEQTLFLLDPSNPYSSIGNLKPSANQISFSTSFPAGVFAEETEFANHIIENVVGTETAFSVTPTNPVSEDLTGASVYLTDKVGLPTRPRAGDSVGRNRLVAWLEGTVFMSIYTGEYLPSEQKIVFKVRTKRVELQAKSVIAPVRKYVGNFGIPNIAENDFVDESNSNVFGEDGYPQRGGFIRKSKYYLFQGDEVSISINNATQNAIGTIEDYSLTSAALRTHFFGYRSASGNLQITSSDMEAVTSFKAGATHDFGIVYYDHRNRPSGVQRIGELYVEHFGDLTRKNHEGKTSVDLRVLHEPPYWAKKWSPVYSKNTSYEKILQVTVAEAAIGRKTEFVDIRSNDGQGTRPIIQGLDGSLDGQIFISMRPLEGKANSYKDFKGADVSYEYKDGDVLRVIEYKDGDGNTYRPMHELPITSYNYYVDNDENPILLTDLSIQEDENNYRRTGWFLTIRDVDASGFSRGDVINGTDFFKNECLVEIYRPKRNTEEESRVFFEVNKQYDIVEVNGVRTHAGDRANDTSPTFSIHVTAENKFTSSERLFAGDKVYTAASSSGYVFITRVFVEGDGTYLYYVDGSNLFSSTNVNGNFLNNTVETSSDSFNSVHYGAVSLTGGDVYLRLREQLVNENFDPTIPDDQKYKIFYVEDESVNDFFDSKAVSVGRAFIETPDQEEIRRHTSVTYSAPFVSDSTVLHLSSFSPLLYPYKDYGHQYGHVCSLVDGGESIMVLQESKVSLTPIERNLIESAQNGMLVTSTQVLGKETYLSGPYGAGMNPESVVNRFGSTYFVDVKAGKVLRVSSKGIEPISDNKMESYFSDLLASFNLASAIPKIPCGYDPGNSEYIVSTNSVALRDIVIEGEGVGGVEDGPSDPDVEPADGKANVSSSKKNLLTWEKETLQWDSDVITPEEYQTKWDTAGSALIYIDRMKERGSVYIEPASRTASTREYVYADVITSDKAYRGTAKISLADGSFSLSDTMAKNRGTEADTGVDAGTTSGETIEGVTVAYSTTKDFWLTFYSFNPELYTHLHNNFFSFQAGQLFKHDANETSNNFYGQQYNSVVEMVSRTNPSEVKVYNSLSLEGNDTWDVQVSNTEQSSDIPEEMFERREGMYYTFIPKDSTENSTSNMSHKVVLGQIESVLDDVVTFQTRVSDLPFGIGDSVYVLESDSETDTSLTILQVLGRKQILVSGNASSLLEGSFLMAVSNSAVNGDKIRDYYAKFRLTNDNTESVELFAINASYTPSPLHNEGNHPTNKQTQ